jgi:predicted amidohydrolase YtcJ
LPIIFTVHCYLISLAMAMVAFDCKALGIPSFEALQKAVYERVASQPLGTWIRGRGYDQMSLRERRHPPRGDWDVVALDHPVTFTHTCGHIVSVSGRALMVANIIVATDLHHLVSTSVLAPFSVSAV